MIPVIALYPYDLPALRPHSAAWPQAMILTSGVA